MFLIFIAEGFEETEALATLDVLRRAELDVVSVGVGAKQITGAHGITTVCDITDAEVETDGLEGIILPGGMPGTLNLEKSPIVKTCIRYAVDNALWLCAICAAPSILGHMNLTAGKRMTCFPGFEDQLTGAVNTGARVERDGKLITGKGMGAAIPFALELVRCLQGEDKAASLEASLQ